MKQQYYPPQRMTRLSNNEQAAGLWAELDCSLDAETTSTPPFAWLQGSSPGSWEGKQEFSSTFTPAGRQMQVCTRVFQRDTHFPTTELTWVRINPTYWSICAWGEEKMEVGRIQISRRWNGYTIVCLVWFLPGVSHRLRACWTWTQQLQERWRETVTFGPAVSLTYTHCVNRVSALYLHYAKSKGTRER